MHHLENWVRRADPYVVSIVLDLGAALSVSGLIVSVLRYVIDG